MPDVRDMVFLEIIVRALAEEGIDSVSGHREEIQAASASAQPWLGSGTNCSAGYVSGTEEKPPIHAKVSKCARPKFSDFSRLPSKDRPAPGLPGRFRNGYFPSMNGIKSLRRSPSNIAKAGAVTHHVSLRRGHSSARGRWA